MKLSTKITAFTVSAVTVLVSGAAVAIAATAPPTLPAEQQALIAAGFKETFSWGQFDKQDKSCHITIQVSGKNYYVFTSGKLKSTLYPVIPSQVVAGATLLDANCQG